MASDIPSPDKVLANPTQIAIFSDEDIIDLQKSGKIVAVARSALASSAAGNEVFSQKDDKGALLPVFVVPREGMDAGSQPAARIIMLTNNRQAVFINEGYHEWNEHYVRKHIMYSKHEAETFLSPQDMLGNLKSFETDKAGFVQTIETPTLQFVGAIEVAAKKSGIDNLKVVVSDKTEHAFIFTTQEGVHYLMIHPSVLIVQSLTADNRAEFLGFVGHEFAHIKNGDTQPQKLIAWRSQEARHAMEILADLTAPAIDGATSN